MTATRKELAREALAAALKLRTSKGRNLVDPICVYDLAEELGIEVRFADVPSLEGMYSSTPRPAIIIGSERPAGRRVYTCGHEVGHHHFGHGTRVDDLRADDASTPAFDPEEFLAQAFAGFLLMPKLAVCNAFSTRGWKPADATAQQVFAISNLFGVTYTGLINHMTNSVGLLSPSSADKLLQIKSRDIREGLVGESKKQLFLVDKFWKARAIDLEVGDLVLAPDKVICEGSCLTHIRPTSQGELFEASQPGHGRFADSASNWASFVRVSRRFYVGRSIYRHLEEVGNE
jgi:Zn-dependent peptidase ImmA (M78 family)